MQPKIVPFATDEWLVDPNLFGGNILANRGGLDEHSSAIDDLGITTLRFPGGSITEHYFDINNPDSPIVVHNDTGEVGEFIPLSDFMNYAETNGHAVSIVIPTKTQLSQDTDDLGHRLPDVDEESLRLFIREVASGEYGAAKINAFEIGNEYWHSGKMDSVEYGRLASEMSKIVSSELEAIENDNPQAESIEVVIQMGYNFGLSIMDEDYGHLSPSDALQAINEDYGLNLDEDALFRGGEVNWTHVNNKIIMKFFDEPEDIEAIDGVIAHIYTLGEEFAFTRYHSLSNLENTWIEEYPELSIHVTEWNQKGITESLERHEDYGLFQAEEMLNILEEFVRVDVDHAQVWPLIQNTSNSLNFGESYGETNVPGAMFSMLSENLPGKQMLDFETSSDRITEAVFDGYNVHGFAGEDELLLYVISDSRDGVVDIDLDLSGLIEGFDRMELTILGVEDGESPGSNRSPAELETIDADTAYVDDFLEVPLDPGEILQVKIIGVQPTEALRPFLPGAAVEADVFDEDLSLDDQGEDAILDFPVVPIADDGMESDNYEEDNYDDIDPSMGMEWLLALLPLLGIVMSFA